MIGELIGLGAGACVDCLMTNAVNVMTTTAMSKLTRLGCKLGVVVVSGVIGKAVGDHFQEQADDFKDRVRKEVKKQKAEQAKLVNEGDTQK